jgi:hypothetical protein
MLDSQESPIEREENRLKEAAELERAAGNPDGPANERLNRLTIFACALYEMCGVECIERPYINPGYPAPTFCEYCQVLIEAGELFCDACKEYISGLLGSDGLDCVERLYEKVLFEGWVPKHDRYRPWWDGTLRREHGGSMYKALIRIEEDRSESLVDYNALAPGEEMDRIG